MQPADRAVETLVSREAICCRAELTRICCSREMAPPRSRSREPSPSQASRCSWRPWQGDRAAQSTRWSRRRDQVLFLRLAACGFVIAAGRRQPVFPLGQSEKYYDAAVSHVRLSATPPAAVWQGFCGHPSATLWRGCGGGWWSLQAEISKSAEFEAVPVAMVHSHQARAY